MYNSFLRRESNLMLMTEVREMPLLAEVGEGVVAFKHEARRSLVKWNGGEEYLLRVYDIRARYLGPKDGIHRSCVSDDWELGQPGDTYALFCAQTTAYPAGEVGELEPGEDEEKKGCGLGWSRLWRKIPYRSPRRRDGS